MGAVGLGFLLNSLGCTQEQPRNSSHTLSLEKTISASEFFKGFPEEIPGAASIKKYPVGDAKYCFVHIRSAHYVQPEYIEEIINGLPPGENRPIVIDVYSVINEVQKNAYLIINHLIDRYGSNEIYTEGVSHKTNVSKRKLQKYLDYLEGEMSSLGIDTNDEENWRYILGAPYLLHFENKVELLSTEYRGLMEELTLQDRWIDFLLLNIQNRKTEESDKEFHNNRENHVLDLIHSDGSSYTIVWFGGGHNWLDNIGKWNYVNPGHEEDRFSLIVITPEGFEILDN